MDWHTGEDMVDKQTILDSVGPVQAVLDAHDGIVNVMDTTDGVIMISLEGGCTGSVSYTHLTLPTKRIV